MRVRQEILAGTKFGMLTVVSEVDTEPYAHRIFVFRCECGNTKPMKYSPVKSGKFVSCGCVKLASKKYLVARKPGEKNPPGPSAASKEHWKSKYWQLKTPSGGVIEGANLNQLIRDNVHLFEPSDVVWNKTRCNASHGIRHLFDITKDGRLRNNSWKGWQIGDKMKIEDAPQ